MEKEKSPFSPGMNLRKRDIPEKVITYFQQRGKFVKSLPSYEQVERRNPIIPEEIKDPERLGMFLEDTYPVINKTLEAKEKADNYAREVIAKFTRNKCKGISKISRTYMLTGYTRPIRATCLIDKETKVSIYVKKPSIERIFGMALYNLLSGNLEQDYIFNGYAFVESEIPGVHPSDINKKHILSRPNLAESLVRLAVLDEFLSINDLERRGGENKLFVNILVQYDGNVAAFDFNTILQPEADNKTSPLLQAFREYGLNIPANLEKAVRIDEARKINARIYGNHKTFKNIIDLADSIPYMRRRVQEKGYKSIENYFKRSTDRLKYKFK